MNLHRTTVKDNGELILMKIAQIWHELENEEQLFREKNNNWIEV